mmetsp:Transcript_5185/g.18607  ORF Transcript_5185/g.18607 Transcript_5185/m.18607 type:complete len:384 (-) Transcript_5185:406-1557(-)
MAKPHPKARADRDGTDLTTAHAAISTVRVSRGVDEKMEKRETTAALLYDLTIFSKVVFIITPVIVVAFALPLGFLLAELEGWDDIDGFYYLMSVLCGLPNGLTDESPTSDEGKAVDIIIVLWAWCLVGTFIGLVANLSVVGRIILRFEAVAKRITDRLLGKMLEAIRSRSDEVETCEELGVLASEKDALNVAINQLMLQREQIKDSSEAHWEERKAHRRARRYEIALDFVMYLVTIFFIVPCLVIVFSILLGFLLAELEGWSDKNGFYYIISMLLGVPSSLTEPSTLAPDTTEGKLVDIIIALWAWALIGTFIGVIGGLATIESFVTWLESGGDSFKKCFGVEMDEHDAHLMDDIDALVAMRETVSKEVFNAEKKLIESLRRD